MKKWFKNLWREYCDYKTLYSLMIMILSFYIYNIINHYSTLTSVMEKVQIIGIPITVATGILGFIMSDKNRKRQLELEKVKMTNQFVRDFMDIMKNITSLSERKYTYYNSVEELAVVYKNIVDSPRHYFDMDYYNQITGGIEISYEEMNKLIRVTEKFDFSKDNEKLDHFVETCSRNLYNSIYLTDSLFYDVVEKHEKRVGEIEAEYTLDYKNIEKRNLKPEPLKKEIKNLKDWKKKSINKEKLIFARAVRQMDSEILNEMECLLFNVNYDLIDYDQIYYLIQEPFLFYIDTFC